MSYLHIRDRHSRVNLSLNSLSLVLVIKVKEASIMSTTKSRVDENHFRETDDDGTKSWLYEKENWFSKPVCIEVTDHHEDGTSTSYKYDGSLFPGAINGGRGGKKS